jgi:DNA-binding HxlR family transcriptional regulator
MGRGNVESDPLSGFSRLGTAMADAAPGYPSPPAVPFQACPIETTLGSLGRKWAITILREVAFVPNATFGVIRKGNPGLRQRTLSNRLRQLCAEGLIRRVVPPGDPRHPYYVLTTKGLDIWPILTSLFQFGTRHHADEVFADGRPRSLPDVYPNDAALLLGPVAEYARGADPAAATAGPRPSRRASPGPRGSRS